MADRLPLARAALAMRSQGPAVWATFLEALRVYAREQADALVIAPADALPVMQGRAQGVRALIGTLESAESEVAKTEKKAEA